MQTTNIGTLNVRGINNDFAKKQLADDMQKYHLDILAIQEHHMKGTSTENIRTTDGKNGYTLFTTGAQDNKYHGVGFVIGNKFSASFETVSDRICKATVNLRDQKRKLIVIATYAETLQQSENNEAARTARENFYETLDYQIRNVSNRDFLFIAGDMNAKTGSGHHQYPSNIGRYGKGIMNSNGQCLADLAVQNELVLTNTFFKHKMAHRTTWEAPLRVQEHKDKGGEIRKIHTGIR